MKTFMMWVIKCQYKNETDYNTLCQYVDSKFYDDNYQLKCTARLYGNDKGGYVEDENGYITKCNSVKEVIALVKFLVDGTIEI